MDAIQLLRAMHADTRARFKIILGSTDSKSAASEWHALKPLLDQHEQLEDQFVYTPLFEEQGPGTPLGDWNRQHETDVAVVKQLIEVTDQFDPSTPEWRMSVARVAATLSKHVMDEEGQIFGRVQQTWSAERLSEAGASMQKRLGKAARPKPVTASAKPAPARSATKPAPARRGR